MHDLPLINTLAAGFAAAWFFGLITQRIGLSPIVGYLLAGVMIGPHTPGFVGDLEIGHQLSEIGVILMMFGVGLHFHLKDLFSVKGIAVPGAIGQTLCATLAAVVVFGLLGIPLQNAVVIGMAMAVASTVVLMRVLLDAGVLNSTQGHVAVGWLIVEDIITVILLVLIPAMGNGAADPHQANGEGTALWIVLGIALLKLAALLIVALIAGYKLVPWILVRVAKLRSHELFTLTILVMSIAVATGAYILFGASMALGAFLAGMVVAQSPVSDQAAADVLPLRDAFSVLFFVSVGMLFDPGFLVQQPALIAGGVVIILFVKPIAALTIVAILGGTPRTGLTVALGLAQIGEFSFILSELAKQNGLLGEAGYSLIVASAIISITLNPLIFRKLPAMENWLQKRKRLWNLLDARNRKRSESASEFLLHSTDHASSRDEQSAIVVGFGPVGRAVHEKLVESGITTIVIDKNIDTVQILVKEGRRAIFGDATKEIVLHGAGIDTANHLIVTVPDATQQAMIVATARSLNANLQILARVRFVNDRKFLQQAGANGGVIDEEESAKAMVQFVLSKVQQEAAHDSN
jgi:CPA2 family monovalent cation:H+ antiporter-2